MVSKNDIDEYLKETINSVKTMNNLLATQVKNVKLGYSRLTKFIQSKDIPDYDRWQLIRSIKLNKFKGILELEQLATVASAIIQYIKYIHDKRNLLLWGCVQSGKTLNYSFLMCILPIIHRLFTKEKIFPVLFVPNKINLCSGAKQELRNLLTLYKDVDVFVDGESASMDAPFTVWYDEIFESKKMDSVIDFLIRQRNPSSVNKFEKSLISLDEQFTEKEIKTLLFHDEKHNGSAVVSIQNDIQFFLNNCKSLHKIIGITATPAEPNSAGGKNYITVVSYVDSRKYMGFGTYNGMNIHDIRNEKIKQPEIKSIEEEFKPKNCYLDLKMFSQEKYFLENRSRYEVFSNQDQYRILKLDNRNIHETCLGRIANFLY